MRVVDVSAVFAAVFVGACAAGVSGCVDPAPEQPERRCNGHAALCDRALDDVVFAGAHNAMSSRDDGFIGPNQSLNVSGQLAFGVRAFLIDTKVPDPDVVRDEAGGVRLCHVSCVLGEVSLVSWLGRVKTFLDDEPDTVVQLLVEDEASVADTEADFVDAGLRDELYEHDDGAAFATLAELIDARTRIFMTAESPDVIEGDVAGGEPPWFRSMFDLYSDTPFAQDDLAAMQDVASCALNRGAVDDPLFLVNHWIGNAAEEHADVANANDVIAERVARCAAERDRVANVVAVDFVDHGDLIAVVDAENGLDD